MLGIILETAHFVWYTYNRFILLLIAIYYHILNTFDNNDYIYVHYQNERTKSSKNSSSKEHVVPVHQPLRIPEHIAMAFTNESDDLDLNSVARLLCWCKQLGIKDVTLYDEKGKLKVKQKELFKFLEYRMGLLGHEKPISDISDIRGLRIISKQDGRQKFVDDIAHLIVKLEPEDIDITSVQNCVGWPSDPELMINFGSPLCLHGFPPWQLRLTEILSIPTHRNLPQKLFIDCLKSYSRTTQRLGA